MTKFRLCAAGLTAALLTGAAHAGPYILAGTDADDHGSVNSSGNQDGWFFMQRALENLASAASLTNTNKTVISLGSSTGEALNAATSAFNRSSLPGSGWTFVSVPNLESLPGTFADTIGGGSILMLDSGGNVSGGLTDAEETVLTLNAGTINSFVGGGGGLFSQANSYGWLSALVPGLSVNFNQQTGLALTAAGSSAFPNLTNQDLSAGPYHANFLNVGAIPVLATGINNFAGRDVIIGAAGGSITNPDPVGAIPEPSTYVLMALGLAGMAGFARRRRKAA
ncbi:MAG: PEP-CTERM sorting domain-containing protein [Burkholderiaceae bacterium]